MRLLPQKFFKWREPKAYLRIHDAREKTASKWWHRPMFILIASPFMMIPWFIARFIPHRDPPPFPIAFALMLALGFFLVYIVPWINSLCPSDVFLLKNHLVRGRGNANLRIPYLDLESFAFEPVSDQFTVLLLKHRKHPDPILIGLPPDFPLGPVTQFLIAHQITLRPISPQTEGASPTLLTSSP